MIKDDLDVKATVKILKENFKMLKDCFVSLAAHSHRYPAITMLDFGRFI